MMNSSGGKLNSRGVSLMEVMITIVILSIISVGLMTFLDNSISAQNFVTFKAEADALTNEIRTTLGDTRACLATFNSATPSSLTVNTSMSSLRDGIYSKTNVLLYATSSTYGDRALVLSTLSMGNYSDTISTEGVANLTIIYTSTKRTAGPTTIARTIPIVTQKASTSLINCYSKAAGSDSLWMAIGSTSVTAIYFANGTVGVGTPTPGGVFNVFSATPALQSLYVDKTTGFVGIGTTTPGVELEVNGPGKFNAPTDYWGPTNAFYGVGSSATPLGQLDHHMSYRVSLTSNGYRNSGNTWTSYAANSTTGAAQVAVDPRGQIQLSTDAVKANGASVIITPRLTVDSSGNVGIGSTAPNSKLHVIGDGSGSAAIKITELVTTADVGVEIRAAGNKQEYIDFAPNSTSEVGSGTPDYGGRIIYNRPGTPNGFQFYANAGATPAMVIDSTGSVGIGTPTPGQALEVIGIVRATSFLSTSDRNEKENIKTSPGLELVTNLRGVSFQWKKDHKPGMGVIAQEVEEFVPELVATDKAGSKSVFYEGLIGPLIESVKELNVMCKMSEAQSQQLAERVQTVERTMASMQNEITELRRELAVLRDDYDKRLRTLEKKRPVK